MQRKLQMEDIKPGMFVAALNSMWRGVVPYKTPLVIKSVGKSRIVAETIPTEGKHSELWTPTKRHLHVSEIISIFPDEATGRARCAAAYQTYQEADARIKALEKEASEAIHNNLRSEA